MSAFSKRLRECRESKDMSIAELAKKINYSDKAVYSWEEGTKECNFDILLKLCEILGEDPNYLLGWDEYLGNNQDK